MSTIKRSDRVIVLSSDGTVAEQGTYKEISSNPSGAFSKLMEWQRSGGETGGGPEQKGPPIDIENAIQALGEDRDNEEDTEEEGLKVTKKEDIKSEVVLEKFDQQRG